MGIKINELDPGHERDRLVKFCRKHCNENKLAEKFCLERIQVPGENPCIVLRRQEKDTSKNYSRGGLLY